MKKPRILQGRKLTFLILILYLSLFPLAASAKVKGSASPFSALSPSELISSINNYRSQNGLNILQNNSLLSLLAQGHAEYQASIGTFTHYGPGGTRPIERAISAGYNGGNVTFYSEIIYAGYNSVTSDAINWWKNSYDHNTMMLSPAFNEIGAGVSSDGSWNYYTVEFGYSSGVETSPNDSESNSTSNDSTSQNIPVIPYAVPVVKATPREDGALIHVIKTGQVPWTLSIIYEIDLDLLLEQNGLTNYSYVYTGDEIIILPSHTPTSIPPTTTATATVSFTATIEATSTETPTRTPRVESTEIETKIPKNTELPQEEPKANNNDDNYIKWLVMASFLIFLILIISSMLSKNTQNLFDNNEPKM